MADNTKKKPKLTEEQKERAKDRKSLKGARKAGKRSFGKAKPGVRAVAGGRRLRLSEDERLVKEIKKELKTNRIEIGGKDYTFGSPERRVKADRVGGLSDYLRELRKTDPVAAAEIDARERARRNGASVAEAEKAGREAAKEEAARQKAKASGKVAPKETPKAEEKPKAKKSTAKKPIVKKLVVKESTLKDIDKLGEEYKKKTQAIGEKREALNKAAKNVSKASVAIDFEDKIKAVEKKMSDNAKAVRAGTMTEAAKVKANKALAEQKNKLQADAKKAGAKVNNPATRPPRQPKAKPTAKKPKVEKKAKPSASKTPVEKKTTAKPEKPAKATSAKPKKTPAKPVTKTDIIKEAEAKTNLKGNEAVKAAGKKGLLRGLLRKSMAVATLMWAEDLISQALPGKPIKGGAEQAVKKMLEINKSKVKGVKPVTGTAQLKSAGAKSSSKASVKKGNQLAGQRYQAQAEALRGKKAEQARWDAKGKAYAPAVKPSTKPSTGSSSGTTTNKKGQTVVTIKRGDTLWDIAQKNKTTVDAIYKANPFLMERKKAGKVQIFSGTTIRLPKK
jgi:LysM repeat protein